MKIQTKIVLNSKQFSKSMTFVLLQAISTCLRNVPDIKYLEDIMRISSHITAALAAAAVAILAIPAGASVVYDNGLPDTQNGYSISNLVTLDDFAIAGGATVRSVGFYFQNYTGITGWDNNISYQFMSDVSGAPGGILASGAGLNVAAVDSGLPWCCGGGNAWLVTFDLASDFIAADGVSYWLGLTGAGGPPPFWVTSGSGNGLNGFGGSFYATGNGLAFNLDGDLSGMAPVPLPAGLPLLAGGILLLGALRRRI